MQALRRSGLLAERGVARGFGAEDRLDVEDGSLVDCFEGVNPEGEAVDGGEGGAVEADGIGAVGGAGGEDSGDGVAGVGARVYAKGIAVGLVEPGEVQMS